MLIEVGTVMEMVIEVETVMGTEMEIEDEMETGMIVWNSHVKTLRIDVAYVMTWNELMKMMTEVYYPRNEIQKLKNELWNLTVKYNDVVGYT
nr:hypothetical protein [Tanacetum cinerariifolium]